MGTGAEQLPSAHHHPDLWVKPSRTKCPVCENTLRFKRMKMRAYGMPRFKTWCGHCDRCFGPVGYFSKKTERQAAKKEEQEP